MKLISWRKILPVIPLLIFLGSCSQTPDSKYTLYRVMDNLKSEDILESPLSFAAGTEKIPEHFYPLKSYALHESETGINPFDIKRKIRLGATEFRILFSPPKSQYSFELSLQENSVLEFGTGIVSDANTQKRASEQGEKKGVTFLITLEIRGRKKTVFRKYVPPPPEKKENTLAFHPHSIELPYKTKKARITFTTTGEERNYSFWFNPVLYPRGTNNRNIILISVDTLRADHLGCYGYEKQTSPNIDALAADSAKFLNVYASSPWTLPSHVSLFTALHCVHHQVYFDNETMDPSLITLTEMLRQNSFSCAAFTGGGFVSAVYGFSKAFNTYNEGSGLVFLENAAEHQFGVVSNWLDRHKDRNFFLFIHTYQPHDPYACPYKNKSLFIEENARWEKIDLLNHLGGNTNIYKNLTENERRNVIGLYDTEIRYTDEELIGPLIRKLKDMDLYDSTIIVFTSDHGEEFYDHGSWGHGRNLYDETLKVPLIIKFPESKYSGRTIDTIVSLVDVFPTILEENRIPLPDIPLDGKSLIPLLKGKEKKDRTFLADLGSNVLNSHIPQKICQNQRKDKLILNESYTKEDLAFFTSPPPKLDPVELYDLGNDPQEKNNIVDSKAGFVRSLIRKIQETYQKAVKRKTGKTKIDEKLKKQLQALGYIR